MRRAIKNLLAITLLLIAARLAAPPAIGWYVNRELARSPEYKGRIADVDLSLLDSEIAFDDLRLERRRGDPKLPFVQVERIEVDYRWDALLGGKIVGDVDLERPVVNIMPAATQKRDPSRQIERDKEWLALVETFRTLLPTKIHHLHIRQGAVRFKDIEADPDVDLRLSRLNLYATNLSNRQAPASELPTRARATARVQKSGRLRAQSRFNIFPKQPTFDLDLALRGLDVRELNDFARAYAKADMERGTAAFFVELKAERGRIRGYFKPMLDDVEVLDVDEGDEDDPWYRKAWEGRSARSRNCSRTRARTARRPKRRSPAASTIRTSMSGRR